MNEYSESLFVHIQLPLTPKLFIISFLMSKFANYFNDYFKVKTIAYFYGPKLGLWNTSTATLQATCWLWVVAHNGWGRDPGVWFGNQSGHVSRNTPFWLLLYQSGGRRGQIQPIGWSYQAQTFICPDCIL